VNAAKEKLSSAEARATKLEADYAGEMCAVRREASARLEQKETDLSAMQDRLSNKIAEADRDLAEKDVDLKAAQDQLSTARNRLGSQITELSKALTERDAELVNARGVAAEQSVDMEEQLRSL